MQHAGRVNVRKLRSARGQQTHLGRRNRNSNDVMKDDRATHWLTFLSQGIKEISVCRSLKALQLIIQLAAVAMESEAGMWQGRRGTKDS